MRKPWQLNNALAVALLATGASAADVLIADSVCDCIRRYDDTGTWISDFVPTGANSGMVWPHRMTWGPDVDGDSLADLYVADVEVTTASGIRVFSGATGAPITLFSLLPDFSQTSNAVVLEFGPDHTGDGVRDIYVLRYLPTVAQDHMVLINGATGVPESPVINSVSGGGLTFAEASVFGPDLTGDNFPEIYVADYNLPRVLRFNGTTGAYIDDLIGAGNPYGLQRGRRMILHTDGMLYIADATGDQVIRVDPLNGAVGSVFVTPSSGGLLRPHDMVFGTDVNGDGTKDLLVCSLGGDEVLAYNGITGGFLSVFVASSGPGAVTNPSAILFFLDNDCNANAIEDAEEIASGAETDCDGSGLIDSCEIAAIPELDADGNGIIDSCELCAGDLDLSGDVGIVDFLEVLARWGACPSPCRPGLGRETCPGDVDEDCIVGIEDFLSVLANWGPCP